MDERVVQFRVGVLVLATFIITVLLVILFGDFESYTNRTYPVTIHLEHARGLQEGATVRKSGLPIGRVTAIDFADDGGVDVDVEINSDVIISRNELPQLRTSLFGDSELEFVPDPDYRTRDGAARPTPDA